uniref:DUF4387 domain-containing protein n=1 Tax=Bionectria ochroleuca TaxID=29856 RepID=A0A8H7N4S5_BIOOC
MFDNKDVYNLVKDSNLLNKAVIAELFRLDQTEVFWAGFFDVAMAFKATMPRKRRGSHRALAVIWRTMSMDPNSIFPWSGYPSQRNFKIGSWHLQSEHRFIILLSSKP